MYFTFYGYINTILFTFTKECKANKLVLHVDVSGKLSTNLTCYTR